jgi:glycosyltransferase involved in cell wall biosynthesis
VTGKLKPKLSVFMITYNHEKYIKRALESILMQKTNFPFEIVIGEDCSLDNTRKICQDYQLKYPDKIRLLNNKKNLGIKENFLRTLHACNGEFIAYLEGDDYWIDQKKIQMQVDFLESNLDFAITCHRAKILDMESGAEYVLSDSNVKEVSTIEDLCKQNLIYANSVLFRVPPERFDGYELDSPVADWVLWVYIAQHGKIKYFHKPMSVYRKHDGGVFSTKNDTERIKMALVAADNWNRITKQKYIESYREVTGLCYMDLLKIILTDSEIIDEDELVLIFQKIAFFLPDNKPLIEAVKRIKFCETTRFKNPYVNLTYDILIKIARYVRLVLGKIKHSLFN